MSFHAKTLGILASALLVAGAAIFAMPAAVNASEAEKSNALAFEAAFAAFVMPVGEELLSPAERLEAEALSAAAPRERKTRPGARKIRSGYASYYGARFAGRRTANGEIFNPRRLTAAHRTLPFGTKVKVTNRRNGKSVIVRINDRGPFHGNRVIDLSKEAARRIGLVHSGHGPVELALLR